jgi:hypothetical protein
LFGNDHRLVGEYQLYRHHGELRLRAEARRPNAETSSPTNAKSARSTWPR